MEIKVWTVQKLPALDSICNRCYRRFQNTPGEHFWWELCYIDLLIILTYAWKQQQGCTVKIQNLFPVLANIVKPMKAC